MKGNKMTLIKRITLIALGAVLVLSSGLVFLTSYLSWDAYYKDMLVKKERFNKEQEPEVTTMRGIAVSVKEGVEFFKNGKALASKSNFVVNGLYTIGNEINHRDYEEEIDGSEYTIVAPEDFTENGGKVEFKYKVEEEKKDKDGNPVYKTNENGEPVLDEKGNKIVEMTTIYDFTESLTIELKDVKLDHLEITENPYIVAYAEGDKFSTNGMKVDAIYNDGSKIENISASLLSVPGNKLTVDDTSVKVAYKYGEGEDEVIYGSVAVKVMSKNDFTNGEIRNLVVIGDMTLEAGQEISDLHPEVYAYYSSGNYIKLDSTEYGISGFKGKAEFGKKYNLVVYSKENTDITARQSVYPVSVVAADNATLSGATAYDGYVKDFDSGDYIEFVYNSEKADVVSLYLDMSNGYLFYENGAFVARSVNFNDFAYISVNNKLKELNYIFNSAGPFVYQSDALSSYQKVSLGSFAVKAGENTVRICFKDSTSGLTAEYGQYIAGAIKDLLVCSQSASVATGSSLGDYVKDCKQDSVTPSFNITKEVDWGTFGLPDGYGWVYATATDGDYLYFYANCIGSGAAHIGKKAARIAKYDIQEKQFVAYTALIDYVGEKNVAFFVRDGYIYVMASNGTFTRIPTSFSGKGTAKAEYVPAMQLKNSGGEVINRAVVNESGDELDVIKSVYFNQSTKKYAALVGNNVLILDLNGNFERSFAMKGTSDGANLARITGDENYIYGVYKNNGKINPATTIYDWSGKLIGEVIPKNSAEIMGFALTENTNIQSAAAIDGTLYFTMVRWMGVNHGSVYKVSFAGSTSIDTSVEESSMDLYDYIAACEEKGVTPVYNKTATQINGTLGYSEGIATDGKYIYIASKDTDMNVVITKYEAATAKLVGKTAQFKRGTKWNNGEYMTYMDGYLYLALDTGAVKRIKTDAITADGTATVEDYTFNVDGMTGKVNALAYNSLVNKIAILTDGKLNVIGAKSMKLEQSVTATITKSLGVTCDANYVYAFYEHNSDYGTAEFNVYDWSGELVKAGITVPHLIDVQSSNNVQGMCVVNGEYYFLVSIWSNPGKLVKVTFDTSILK